MFDELVNLDWQDCGRVYTRVEKQIGSLTGDVAQRAAIYKVLWERGGRCDCTTAFNIVKRPDVRAEVESAIQAIVTAA